MQVAAVSMLTRRERGAEYRDRLRPRKASTAVPFHVKHRAAALSAVPVGAPGARSDQGHRRAAGQPPGPTGLVTVRRGPTDRESLPLLARLRRGPGPRAASGIHPAPRQAERVRLAPGIVAGSNGKERRQES